MVQRPDDLNAVADILARLAIEGRVHGGDDVVAWLGGVGVGDLIDVDLYVREEWVASTLPAKNPRDLLRRTLFRDTGYRLHLDCILARVLAKMASDSRMAKVEDYLLTKLTSFAPRLAWLLDQLTDSADNDAWDRMEAKFLANSDWNRFSEWDKVLFGDILGGAEQRFPLISDIYGARAGDPVYARVEYLDVDPTQASLLADIILAGVDRQGVMLGPNDDGVLESIVARTGLPIRIWRSATLGNRAACIGPVVLIGHATLHVIARDRCPVPGELARELSGGRLTDSLAVRPPEDIWAIVERGGRTGAFAGVNIFERTDAVLSLFDRESPDYLLKLSSHSLFGLLLQFFVIEAFDRELGEDSLTVLPVGSAENPERVDVYYRPAGEGKQYQLLGSVDDVLTTAAEHIGLYTPPRLWEQCQHAMWTQSLLALVGAKVLAFQSGEFVLERGVFDLCHSRDHMQAVLRRGQAIRDRIHEALRAQYEAKACVVDTEA